MAEPVIAYVRVSRVGERGGDAFLSPQLQLEACEREAEKSGLTIIKKYEELDASGGDATRPLWNQAIEEVEHGKAKGIVVWNLTRFSRSLVDAINAIERIEKAGGTIYSASGEAGDNTPTGKLTRNIFLSLAQMERERARDSFALAQASAIDRGIAIASTVPTGYMKNPATRKYELDPKMAPLIRGCFERRAKGDSWASIAKWFTEQGGHTAAAPQTIRTFIMNRTYLGEVRFGDLTKKGSHPPIVSQKLFDEANAQRRAKLPATGAAARALFRGLIQCDGCGHNLIITGRKGGSLGRKYSVHLCDGGRSWDSLDDFMTDIRECGVVGAVDRTLGCCGILISDERRSVSPHKLAPQWYRLTWSSDDPNDLTIARERLV